MIMKVYLALALALCPTLAVAQTDTGPYLSGAVGANFAGALLSSHSETKAYTDPGPAGLVALGWRFGNGLRAEIEADDRSNGVNTIRTHRLNGEMLPLENLEGRVQTYAGMANLFYDIPVRPFGLPIRPYVGVGAGYGTLDFGKTHGLGHGTIPLPQDNSFTGPLDVVFREGGAFAYQAMVGASWPIDRVHGLELTADYRFFGMAQADVPVARTGADGDYINGVLPFYETRNGFQARNSSLMFGLRYRLGSH
jgi:OOP family OmpA-OmpF porin